jgi:hypothetical protein
MEYPALTPGLARERLLKMLTEPCDIVLDPFGGSNTTGKVAESLERRWIASESVGEYLEASISFASMRSTFRKFLAAGAGLILGIADGAGSRSNIGLTGHAKAMGASGFHGQRH